MSAGTLIVHGVAHPFSGLTYTWLVARIAASPRLPRRGDAVTKLPGLPGIARVPEPAIVEVICVGQQPADLTAEKLKRCMDRRLD
jgi:hypothetical protein